MAEDLDARIAKLAGWTLDGRALAKTFEFADFEQGVDFVNRVARVAEEQNHHPDIDLRYGTVTIRLTSHDAGTVTGRDLALAEAIEAL